MFIAKSTRRTTCSDNPPVVANNKNNYKKLTLFMYLKERYFK